MCSNFVGLNAGPVNNQSQSIDLTSVDERSVDGAPIHTIRCDDEKCMSELVRKETWVTVIKLVSSLGGLWLLAFLWVWAKSRRLEKNGSCSTCPAIVLGCPSKTRLARRVQAAADLFHSGRADGLIISGLNEAQMGQSTALESGVPLDKITLERRATNTKENIVLSARLTARDEFWLVTCRWHLPRALAIARRHGITSHPCPVEEPASPFGRLRRYTREAVSVVHHLV